MSTYEVTVTWKAFKDALGFGKKITSVTVSYDFANVHSEGNILNDTDLLDKVWRDTNLYKGSFWRVLEPVLPENRTHTAMSVGDEVTINGRSYYCNHIGWKRITEGANQ
jgi:hypothetical protein